jgi:hypothetical protein
MSCIKRIYYCVASKILSTRVPEATVHIGILVSQKTVWKIYEILEPLSVFEKCEFECCYGAVYITWFYLLYTIIYVLVFDIASNQYCALPSG